MKSKFTILFLAAGLVSLSSPLVFSQQTQTYQAVEYQAAPSSSDEEHSLREVDFLRMQEAKTVQAENKARERVALRTQQYYKSLEKEAKKAERSALHVEKEIRKAERAEQRAIQARKRADRQEEATRLAIDRYLNR
jgi:hypothetical protein